MELTSPPSSWYEPADEHELDNCEGCHQAGLHHDEIEVWANGRTCLHCEDELNDAILNDEYCLLHHDWYCEEIHNEEEQQELKNLLN